MLLGLAHFRAVDAARKPVPNASITVRWMLPFSKNFSETTVTTDENGVAIVAIPPAQMPQLPIEADYRVGATTGRVTVGGNNATPITEITVNAA
jgi:hypothetical protein